ILPPVGEQLLRPRLKRNLHRSRRPRFARISAGTRQPQAGLSRSRPKIHFAIRIPRSRTRRRSRTPRRTLRSGKLSPKVGVLAEREYNVRKYQRRCKSKDAVTHRFLLRERIIVDFRRQEVQ